MTNNLQDSCGSKSIMKLPKQKVINQPKYYFFFQMDYFKIA